MRKKLTSDEKELFGLARNGRTPLLRDLVTAHPELLTATNTHGNGALSLAVICGRAGTVKALLELGASSNSIGKSETHILHQCLEYFDENVFKALVSNGSDVNRHDEVRGSPLNHMLSMIQKNQISARRMLRHLELMLKNMANPNSRIAGESCMHQAAKLMFPEVINLLHSYGGDLSSTNLNGDTPLHLAMKLRNFDTAMQISNLGGSFLNRNNDGLSPLDLLPVSAHKPWMISRYEQQSLESEQNGNVSALKRKRL